MVVCQTINKPLYHKKELKKNIIQMVKLELSFTKATHQHMSHLYSCNIEMCISSNYIFYTHKIALDNTMQI